MESRSFVAVVLLGLLATANCQQPHAAGYQELQAQPVEKQLAQIGSLIYNLIQPAFSNILAAFTTNLGSSITNAFSATLGGKKLQPIPLESLLAEPIKESPAPTASLYTVVGGEPPKRRPYTRSMVPEDEKPLQSSQPETTDASSE